MSPFPPRLVFLVSVLAAARALAAWPPDDLSQFELDPRLEIRLWTAEPDIVDPVSLCFDAAGVAYVAECRDYPYGVGPEGKVGSTVRRLEDTNGDGRPDRVTVFAKDLSYATSVTPWRDGVLVAAAPDLLFLKDTNGDGVAEVREVVVTGFRRGVSDSLVNGLCYGPDNRIHGANGGNGGTLRAPRKPGSSLALGDDDFAFLPDTGELFATGRSGGGFGLVFDDWGRAFTTYNINHLQHRYLDRPDYHGRPGFPPIETTTSLSDHEDMSRIFPRSEAQTRPNHPEQSGHFSAAGGMGRIGAAHWPDDLRGSLLVCDVVGNLVHRDVLHAAGAAFVASRAATEQEREFLTSRDPHFRPVGLTEGPDGALYLLDMQRDVIEHPDYIPARVRERQDIRAGQDRGRIYRISLRNPAQSAPQATLPAGRPDAEVVALLAHPDPWWRTTAQRLLVERRATAVAEGIRRLARSAPLATGRVQALWTLDGLHQVQSADLIAAMSDPVPEVRESALALIRRRGVTDVEVARRVLERCEDPQARVRFAALLATIPLPPDVSVTPSGFWERRIRADAGDPWLRRAIWAVLPVADRVPTLRALLSGPAIEGVALQELADLIGATPGLAESAPGALLTALSDPTMEARRRASVLAGLQSGLTRSGGRPQFTEAERRQLDQLAGAVDPQELATLWRLSRWGGIPDGAVQSAALERARKTAADVQLPIPAREASLALLEFGGTPADTACLLGALTGTEPARIQTAALRVLRSQTEPRTGAALVERWRSYAPGVRPEVLQLLLSRRAFHEPLVSALERQRITVGELNLDLEQRRRLLRQSTPDIAERAGKFLGDEEYSNRKALVSDWLTKLPATGDPTRGRSIFEQACAPCHSCAGLGQRVGPDLNGVAHRSVEDLLGNILDPNMAINPGFVAYQAETRDGESPVGLLTAAGTESITLVQAGNQRITIPRNQLVRLESTGTSLMPEGLEAGRTPQELRDLIAFLQGSRGNGDVPRQRP